MTFQARPIVELKQRDKSKIESLLAYGTWVDPEESNTPNPDHNTQGDRLLVGLNTGALRIYRVNEPSDTSDSEPAPPPTPTKSQSESKPQSQSQSKPVDLLREEEKFSKKPVQQLAIIKEANILVSLSDGYVSIHDLQSYALQEKLERTKGATVFATISSIVKDPETDVPSISSKLAVAVKRKILLWSWHDMELSADVQEFTLVSTVKSLTWATADRIVAGMDPGFSLVDVKSKDVVDIVKPGSLGKEDETTAAGGIRFGAVSSTGMGYMGMGSWVPKPMATKLADGEMLLAKDVNSMFIDSDGKAVERRQVPWALAPDAVGYSYPYMLVLQPPTKGALDVRNPSTLSLLQSISLPNATILHVPQPNISLAHAGKGFLVASDRAIWRMSAIGYDEQIESLVSHSRFDEAISLLNLLEDTLLDDKAGKIRQIKTLKAQGLFEKRKYRDALDLFSEAETPPASVISMYPRSIAAELSQTPASDDEGMAEGADGKDSDKQSIKTVTVPSPQGTLTKSMIRHFKLERHASTSTIHTVRNGADSASIRGKPAAKDQNGKALEGKDFAMAVNELCSFLVQTRTQIQRFLNKDGTLKQPLPTAQDRKPDYRPPFYNYIDLDVDEGTDTDPNWEQKLIEVASLVDTTLFRAYMLVRPTLAGPLFRVDNFCDPEVVNEKLYESGRYADLIDFLHGKRLHKEALELLAKFGKGEESQEPGEAATNLRGPTRTVAYIQQLPPEMIDLILDFARWPLQTNPDLGMQIFLADTENAETLPRHKVLEFLSELDANLATQYLEHVINELNDLTPDFHQRLIDLYLEILKDANADDSEKQNVLQKLQDLLRKSEQYNRARVFGKLPNDNPLLYEARAIVLSKMGQHKQALQIYVFQIKDYDKAEDYCNQLYLTTQLTTPSTPTPFLPPTEEPEDSSTPSIYHTLLSLYLNPPPPHSPNWPPALSLLSKHGARLPASSTLSLIPNTLPISDLESYFRGRIRSAVSCMREEAMVARLKGVVKADVEAKLKLGEQSRRVLVGEERVCAVCHKRFGGSAIRVYPDNTVTHYGCVRNSGSSFYGRTSSYRVGG